jgi:succinylglutamic semialdehyde dehydrogenase
MANIFFWKNKQLAFAFINAKFKLKTSYNCNTHDIRYIGDQRMPILQSTNPATDQVIWEGEMATAADVNIAVGKAREALKGWLYTSFDDRLDLLNNYQKLVERDQEKIAQAISDEVGKPRWEAKTEAATVVGKLAISVSAYKERTPVRHANSQGTEFVTRHRPHGVMGVIGPFNFPAHLPTGHIIPSLLAGNTVVFKPSEYTPYVGQLIVDLLEEAGLPEGVINIVHGADEAGKALVAHPDLNGLLFTGSYATGKKIHEQFAGFPEKILALEMGGNGPLVVDEVQDVKAAILTIIQSAYLSAGQRCNCARRLIVPKGSWGDQLIERLAITIPKISVNLPSTNPEPFIGTMINAQAAKHVLDKQEELIKKGGKIIVKAAHAHQHAAMLSPGLIDMTGIKSTDEEIFGPFLQIIRVDDIESAMHEANNTQYGLSSGILTDDKKVYEAFYSIIRAGLVSWNRPTTGSPGIAPFGGIGHSGNHRPSAYYAADYAVYPCVSGEVPNLVLPDTLPNGIVL